MALEGVVNRALTTDKLDSAASRRADFKPLVAKSQKPSGRNVAASSKKVLSS